MIESQYLQRSGRSLLFLPLPPGTNHRLTPIRMGGYARQVLSKASRSYLENVGTAIKWWKRRSGFKTIETYTTLPVWIIMRRRGSDCHNYLKELCDVLQVGEVVKDDCFLLPQIIGVWHDAKKPEVVIKL